MRLGQWRRRLWAGWRQRGRLARLEEAVRAHLPVLPLVSAQLRDSNQHVEAAVSQVGASFERMVQGAREGVGEAARLLGDGASTGSDAQPSIGAALADSRATLEAMLSRFVADGDVALSLIDRLHGLEKDMGRVVGCLADVDKISFGNSILALNAKIEAAHIGDRGAGFEVVAQELWSQAQRSEEITEGIRTTVLQVAQGAREAAADITRLLCADRARIASLQREVEAALDRLRTVYEEMQGSLASAGRRQHELTAEIAAAVQTLQFQDRLSQRILHLVEALETMHTALTAPIDPSTTDAGACAPAPAASLLAGAYSMERERDVHEAVMGAEQSERKELSDVEIF
jgi:methyl-accepting chemotaxis protein